MKISFNEGGRIFTFYFNSNLRYTFNAFNTEEGTYESRPFRVLRIWFKPGWYRGGWQFELTKRWGGC